MTFFLTTFFFLGFFGAGLAGFLAGFFLAGFFLMTFFLTTFFFLGFFGLGSALRVPSLYEALTFLSFSFSTQRLRHLESCFGMLSGSPLKLAFMYLAIACALEPVRSFSATSAALTICSYGGCSAAAAFLGGMVLGFFFFLPRAP